MMKKLTVLLVLASALTSCMYKSVMEGEADNIIKARIYNFEGRNNLVMAETVFQATSKEGGRGITIITGFSEQRISVYNLEDGSLIIRKKTGRQNKLPLEFLGCTPGKLWFYSSFDGIHALDPETLEINVTQETIFEKNPEIKDKLATCEWYELPRYFQFRETNTFKEVFSKGSPEFGFSQFEIEDNKLIIIWMLHVHCIDMETGAVLWKFRV